uniref:ATP synthase F0 subunit 8 n=1 Tax=Dolomedes angustivirgatus TaxID=492287 RepID=A0A1C8V699_9ARAC|nr:ATP synthase F0 subunit 8 [Dolomedes angustivirgatus]ANW36382.1 ATP synthase F0 subunit 8 [Dolomedes angustivirgatus]
MPQLMPFYWINSVFMVFMVMFTLVIFYYLKMMEEVYKMHEYKGVLMSYNLMW